MRAILFVVLGGVGLVRQADLRHGRCGLRAQGHSERTSKLRVGMGKDSWLVESTSLQIKRGESGERRVGG